MATGGIDWGRHSDWTVACRVAGRSPGRYCLDRYARLRRRSWDQIVGLIRPVVAGSRVTLTDGTGVGDALADRIPRGVAVSLIGRGSGRSLGPNRLSLTVRQLFSPLFALINAGDLSVECEAPELQAELTRFCASFTQTGHVRLGARSGHDDSVFALALAVYGEVTGVVYGQEESNAA